MHEKKIAFIFPGQGSQSLGMLAEIATQYPQIQKTFQEASEVLGYDLWQLSQNGPLTQLNQTQYTQPIVLAASIALWRIWQDELQDTPVILAGHSLGEYSALVCAGVLDFTEAIDVVAARGHYMQSAVPEGQGAMGAVIGLSDQAIAQLCDRAAQADVLAPANLNAPGQTVLSGNASAIDRALYLARHEFSAKLAKRIPVSVPAHCILMQSAAQQLLVDLEKINFRRPSIDVINNVDAAIASDPETIKSALIRQMCQPVRWVETIQFIVEKDITLFIECGPGKVLTGLNKRMTSILTVSIMDRFSVRHQAS